MVTVFFIITYFMQNFVVNSVDYLLYRKAFGYYNDAMFQQMFSYKLYQCTLCILIAFIFSQTLKPSLQLIKENPFLLKQIFKLTIPLNVLMLITFLYELTFYD